MAPRPCSTAIVPPSSGRNQRAPSCHSGPPNSSWRGLHRRLPGAPAASGSARRSSHQPSASETYSRVPSESHSICGTDSSGPPANGRTPVKAPSSVMSASSTVVPSHGIRGWSQAIQAARRPSGEIRGPVTKRFRSSLSSRTAARSPAAEPSSGTAAITRRTSVGRGPVNSSRTHHTSPRSSRSTGSAQRSPPPTAETGVSGRGAASPSGAWAYNRWSAKWQNTRTARPSASTAPAQGWPPYSMTRLRTFQGVGSGVCSVPSGRLRTSARRPPSAGRASVHHTSSPTTPTYSGRPSCSATSRASIGDGQAP